MEPGLGDKKDHKSIFEDVNEEMPLHITSRPERSCLPLLVPSHIVRVCLGRHYQQKSNLEEGDYHVSSEESEIALFEVSGL